MFRLWHRVESRSRRRNRQPTAETSVPGFGGKNRDKVWVPLDDEHTRVWEPYWSSTCELHYLAKMASDYAPLVAV